MADKPPNKTRIPTADIQFVENVDAPEVYADEASHYFRKNGNIEITFASARLDASGNPPYPIKKVVVQRVVLPASGAQSLALSLYNFLAEHGMAPKSEPGSSN